MTSKSTDERTDDGCLRHDSISTVQYQKAELKNGQNPKFEISQFFEQQFLDPS